MPILEQLKALQHWQSLCTLTVASLLPLMTTLAAADEEPVDCCIAIEERVSELGATTVQKNAKPISINISGWSNIAMMLWDDGAETNTYILDNTYASTRFRFHGTAQIDAQWSTEYRIIIETLGARTAAVDASNDNGAGPTLRVRDSKFYIRNKDLGSLSIGLSASPNDNIALYSNMAGLPAILSGAQGDFLANSSFAFGNLRAFQIAGSIQSGSFFDNYFLTNIVRYDTPTIAGFNASIAWGEDDYWHTAITTSRNIGDFSFRAAASYHEFDENYAPRSVSKEANLQANLGVMHNPTGLYIHGLYSGFNIETNDPQNDIDNIHGWHLQAGIKNKWNALGNTIVWGGYTEIRNGYQRTTPAQLPSGTQVEMSKTQAGVIQEIDAAAMHVYATFEHHEAEITNTPALNDFDLVLIGGAIRF